MRKQKQKKNKNKRSNNGYGPNGSYSGRIIIGIRPAWKKSGRLTKPRNGAEMTVRQVVNGVSFAVKTGFSGGTNRLQYVNTGGFAFTCAHALSDLVQASSWTGVFDQYRFEEIELHFLPWVSSMTQTSTAVNIFEASQMVIDYDDAGTLGSEAALLEYDNCQTFMPYDSVVVRYKPAVSPAYYTGGAFTGYGVIPSDKNWIDAASPTVQHFGVKGWLGSTGATSTQVMGFVVYAQYTVSFRNVH